MEGKITGKELLGFGEAVESLTGGNLELEELGVLMEEMELQAGIIIQMEEELAPLGGEMDIFVAPNVEILVPRSKL